MCKKLTDKRQRFVLEYLIDFNATRAAKDSGYSAKTAYSQGQRLLKDVEIQRALQIAIAARSERTEVTADEVVKELAYILRGRITDVLDWNESGINLKPSDDLSDAALAGISEVKELMGADGMSTIQVKRYDKIRAAELLGKHLGMFVEKADITLHLESLRLVDELLGKIGEEARDTESEAEECVERSD